MLRIGNIDIKVPIFQGGMAIGVSMSDLAASVCNAGLVGVIGGTVLSKWDLLDEIK